MELESEIIRNMRESQKNINKCVKILIEDVKGNSRHIGQTCLNRLE